MACAIWMPCPWMPGALVVMKPSSSGRMEAIMPLFAPKPPEAMMTAGALMLTVLPLASSQTMPRTTPMLSRTISFAVVSSSTVTPRFSRFCCSRGTT